MLPCGASSGRKAGQAGFPQGILQEIATSRLADRSAGLQEAKRLPHWLFSEHVFLLADLRTKSKPRGIVSSPWLAFAAGLTNESTVVADT